MTRTTDRRAGFAAAGRILAAAALFVAMTGGVIAPASAQERQVPESEAQVQLSFAPVVKQAIPAVVNIYASRRVQVRRSPLFDDPLFRHFFQDQMGDQPPERMQKSLGSGVIVGEDGVVITNDHVINGADQIRVALADRREFDAEVLLTDERTDLAILRLQDTDGESFPTVPFADSDELEVGDLVLAIGDPFGVGQTVTQGIVSALARTQVGISDYRFFIQTDAAINPGNSGGALIDMQGRLVGINSAIYSRSGGSLGIGFAIPANMAQLVVRSALEEGEIRRPWFGATMQGVTSDIADGLGLDRPRGALVTRLTEESPAHRAGLRVGDLILMIAGRPVEDPDAFGYRFVTQGVGGTTEITILRNGNRLALTVALEPPPETTPRDTRELLGSSPLTGAQVMNLSPAVAEEVGIDFVDEGVVVSDIRPGSTAQRVGLQRGDIVVEINGNEIETTRYLEELSEERPRVWRITIERDGRRLQMAFRG